MKSLLIGLAVGATAVCFWYRTYGKISITETKTITNTVVIVETQTVERTKWVDVYRTNEIWKTNIVEISEVKQTTPNEIKPAAPIAATPAAQTPVRPVPPPTAVRQPVLPDKPKPSTFRGPRPVDGRPQSGRFRLQKRMDGTIVTNYY